MEGGERLIYNKVYEYKESLSFFKSERCFFKMEEGFLCIENHNKMLFVCKTV